eukprot:3945102-Pyramimonas_sp.AAC.1
MHRPLFARLHTSPLRTPRRPKYSKLLPKRTSETAARAGKMALMPPRWPKMPQSSTRSAPRAQEGPKRQSPLTFNVCFDVFFHAIAS